MTTEFNAPADAPARTTICRRRPLAQLRHLPWPPYWRRLLHGTGRKVAEMIADLRTFGVDYSWISG